MDYAGLPYVAALLGVTDLEHLLDALLIIKQHKPEAEREAETEGDE